MGMGKSNDRDQMAIPTGLPPVEGRQPSIGRGSFAIAWLSWWIS